MLEIILTGIAFAILYLWLVSYLESVERNRPERNYTLAAIITLLRNPFDIMRSLRIYRAPKTKEFALITVLQDANEAVAELVAKSPKYSKIDRSNPKLRVHAALRVASLFERVDESPSEALMDWVATQVEKNSALEIINDYMAHVKRHGSVELACIGNDLGAMVLLAEKILAGELGIEPVEVMFPPTSHSETSI